VLEIYRPFAWEGYCHLQVGRMFVCKGATLHKSALIYYFSATYGSKTTTTTTTTKTTTAVNNQAQFQQCPQVTVLIMP
jgi:hypothetical protein